MIGGRSESRLGCAISYGSFRADKPPPSNNLFGRSLGPGLHAACTNPANPTGKRAALHPYFPVNGASAA